MNFSITIADVSWPLTFFRVDIGIMFRGICMPLAKVQKNLLMVRLCYFYLVIYLLGSTTRDGCFTISDIKQDSGAVVSPK
jgi:hypothetical protein